MAENPNISDQELLDLLHDSKIDENQQKDLELLIPELSGEERNQLIDLIERSKTEVATPDPAAVEQLTKEFESEVKKENENLRENFEKIDKAETDERLTAVEGEIANVKSKEKKNEATAPQPGEPTKKKGGKSAKLFILIILLLGLLAGGAIAALQFLS